MDLVKKKPTGKVVKAMPELNEDFSQKVVQFSVEEKKKALLKESAIFEGKGEADYQSALDTHKRNKDKIRKGQKKKVKSAE